MKNFVTLNPVKYVNGNVNIPGSKSISNRVLLLAAQSFGTTRIINLPDNEDIFYMILALKKIGIKIRFLKKNRVCEVYGIGGPLSAKNSTEIFIGNSGTAMRFLTAALCICNKNIIINGKPGLKKRPISHLVDALRQGGAVISYLKYLGYPPINLSGGYLGGYILLDSSISSQFLSGLLMMSPLAQSNSIICIKGNISSRPYIDITLSLMKKFKVNIKHDNYKKFYINANSSYYSPGEYFVESDASSASYFLASSAIRGGTIKIKGIDKNSIQGDIIFADILKKMGSFINFGNGYIECSRSTLRGIDVDLNYAPDIAMTVAIVSLFTNGDSTILRNISNWKFKETNRMLAMSTELRKVGASIVCGNDYIKITPPKRLISSIIDTYEDHRMAMCFSLLSLSNIPITIINPKCVKKSFPNFFYELSKIAVL